MAQPVKGRFITRNLKDRSLFRRVQVCVLLCAWERRSEHLQKRSRGRRQLEEAERGKLTLYHS